MSHPLKLSLANQQLDRLQTKQLQELALRQSLVILTPHYFPNQSPHHHTIDPLHIMDKQMNKRLKNAVSDVAVRCSYFLYVCLRHREWCTTKLQG